MKKLYPQFVNLIALKTIQVNHFDGDDFLQRLERGNVNYCRRSKT